MVRLLFDENLPRRLAEALADLFPGSVHVSAEGLSRADDRAVWRHAADRGFLIVSKDGDFHQMSFLYGAPPKVVWLRAGNSTTDEAIAILRSNADAIRRFSDDGEAALLVIGR